MPARKFDSTVIKEILAFYERHKEVVAQDQSADSFDNLRDGWLRRVMADNNLTGEAKNLIETFGEEREFLVALAEFLIEKKIAPVPKPKPKKTTVAADFMDRLQDTYV